MCEKFSITATKSARKRPSLRWRINTVCIALYFITAVCASMTPCAGYELTQTTTTSTSLQKTYASSVPSRTIEAEVGSNVNITCHIDKQPLATVWLSVCYENGTKGIINASNGALKFFNNTAVFMLKKLTEQRAVYTCRNEQKEFSNTTLYVGRPPGSITKSLCVNNESRIICEFNKTYNGLPTNYTFKFEPANTPYPLPSITMPCSENPDGLKLICNTSMKVDKAVKFYNLTVTSQNKLGTNWEVFNISVCENIVFAKLPELNSTITGNTVMLNLNDGRWDSYIFSALYKLENPYIMYEIGLKAGEFDWEYQFFNISIEQHNLTLTNLLGNYNYKLSLRKRVAKDPVLWNEPCNGTCKTQAVLPLTAPITNVGGFYNYETNNKVQLFWQEVPQHEHYGNDFFYLVQQYDGRSLKNINQTQYANITLDWNNATHDYYIKSMNEVGISKAASHIRIYGNAQDYNPSQVGVLISQNSSTIYWTAPKNPGVSNYTVMWCAAKILSNNQCNDSTKFIYVDAQQTNFTLNTQDMEDMENRIFAVAANYYNLSSGLHWSLSYDNVKSDLVDVVIDSYDIGNDHIELQWSKGKGSALIDGYNITYCEAEPVVLCNSSRLSHDNKQELFKYNITPLKPNTWYNISIFMYSKYKIGPYKYWSYKTLEAAPSEPRNFKIIQSSITSNSVNLTWEAPLKPNGNIQKYTIWYSLSNSKEKPSNQTVDKNSLRAYLGSLKSFSEYEVYVTASTVAESNHSEHLSFTTLITVPSAPMNVSLNQSISQISWLPPLVPSGRVEFYLVRRVTTHPDLTKSELILDAVPRHTLSYSYNQPNCETNMRFEIQVRAINVAAPHELDNKTFKEIGVNDVIKHQSSYSHDTNYSANTESQIHRNAETLKCSNGDIMDLTPEVMPHVLAILQEHTDNLKFLCSAWATDQNIIQCSPPNWNLLILIVCLIVLLFVIMYIVAWAWKKYKSMEIVTILPDGLCPQDAPEYNVEKKTNFEQQFNKRMVHPMQTESNSPITMGLDNSGVYTYQLGSLNTYTTLLTNTNTSSPESMRNSSVNINSRSSMSSVAIEHNAEKSLLSNSSSSINEINCVSPKIVKAKEYQTSGYVNPEQLKAISMEPNIAYSKISQLQHPVSMAAVSVNLNDYIEASSLDETAVISTASEQIMHHTNHNNKNNATTIWGYVTQKQLAEFSQENR